MVKDVVGIVTAVLVLAGIAVAIKNGGQTAQVIGASTTGFANVIGAATHG